MEFSDLVHKRRAELNLTMDELGKKVGVSKATIQRWESGEIKNVRRDKIAKLAEALQTTPAYLMGWDTQEHVFHKNLAYLMQQNDISLAVLSEQTNIPISRLEILLRDEDNPIVSELKTLAIYFNVTNKQFKNEKLYEQSMVNQEHYMSKEENEILNVIKKLNSDGCNKVLDYAHDLIENDKYKK